MLQSHFIPSSLGRASRDLFTAKPKPPSPLHRLNSAINNHATIRMQTLARDETAILAGEEDEASRDLAGLTRSTHRRAAELILCVFVHG